MMQNLYLLLTLRRTKRATSRKQSARCFAEPSAPGLVYHGSWLHRQYLSASSAALRHSSKRNLNEIKIYARN